MKNFLSSGGRVRFTGTAKNAGDLHVVGDRVGVVAETVTSSETGVIVCEGEFDVPKLSTDVVAAGVKLWYDAGNNRLTLTASTHKFAGWATEAAGNGVAKVKVDLAGGSHAT